MKLRLRENSIRLRLLQAEVSELRKKGKVSEKIQFGKSQNLIYSLQIAGEAKEISAFFQTNEIVVKIPLQAANDWIDSEQVGLKTEQTSGGEKPLLILIEKDFVCVDRPLDADNQDAFPHPKLMC